MSVSGAPQRAGPRAGTAGPNLTRVQPFKNPGSFAQRASVNVALEFNHRVHRRQ